MYLEAGVCKWCKIPVRVEISYDCDCKTRIACEYVGQVGHRQCGMCVVHNEPRMVCGCLAEEVIR